MQRTLAEPPCTENTCDRVAGGGAAVAAVVGTGAGAGAVVGPGEGGAAVVVPGGAAAAVVVVVDPGTPVVDVDGSGTVAAATAPVGCSDTSSPTACTAVHASAIDAAVPRIHTTARVARLRTTRVCRSRPKGTLKPWQSAAVAIIVLIEDDSGIRTALSRALGEKGHAVRSASSGMAGLADVVDDPPDVVVLDLGLPDVDGTEVLRMLRAVSAVPVIVATARDDEAEIVRTLDAGADDYVVKPFSGEQLDARIRALLRRGTDRGDGPVPPLEVGGLVIDPSSREATLDGRPLDLSRKEFDLLHHLAANAGRVVTKRELLAEVWHQAYGGADKTVDVHLSWLRRKLGETAAEPRYLRTVRGVGVRLVEPE